MTICRLAWFSTITHLAALSSWHRQLQKNTMKRILRLVLMSCLAVMLVAALMVTADTDFNQYSLAVCYMRVPRPRFNIANPDAIFSCVLLGSNIFIQIFKIYNLTAKPPFQKAKIWVLRLVRRMLSWFSLRLQSLPLGANVFVFMLIPQPFIASMVYFQVLMFTISSATFEVSSFQCIAFLRRIISKLTLLSW